MDRAERRRRVVALHAEKTAIRAIARRLGIGVATVYRDLEAEGVKGPANLPPAPPGNLRTLQHGLESTRVVGAVIEPRARTLAPQIVDAHPHLDQVRDGAAVLRLAMAYARLEHAYVWLAEQSDELFADRSDGRVHGLLGRVAQWEAQAGREEERLAISPRERTRLKLDKLGVARGLGGEGDRLDFSRLTENELDEWVRLRAKAGAIEADSEAVAA